MSDTCWESKGVVCALWGKIIHIITNIQMVSGYRGKAQINMMNQIDVCHVLIGWQFGRSQESISHHNFDGTTLINVIWRIYVATLINIISGFDVGYGGRWMPVTCWSEGGGMVTSEGGMVTGKAHENGRRQPITGSKGSSCSIFINIKASMTEKYIVATSLRFLIGTIRCILIITRDRGRQVAK